MAAFLIKNKIKKVKDLKDFSVLPDIIRGYEEVRLETMTEFYQKSDNLFKS